MLTSTAFLDLVRDGFDPARPLVLQTPLREATWVAARLSDGTEVRVHQRNP